MNRRYVQQKRVEKAMLYRVVYEMTAVKLAVAALFTFFLLHPTLPVFAAEIDSAEEVVEASVNEVVEQEVAEDPVEEVSELKEDEIVLEQEILEDPVEEDVFEVSEQELVQDVEVFGSEDVYTDPELSIEQEVHGEQEVHEEEESTEDNMEQITPSVENLDDVQESQDDSSQEDVDGEQVVEIEIASSTQEMTSEEVQENSEVSTEDGATIGDIQGSDGEDTSVGTSTPEDTETTEASSVSVQNEDIVDNSDTSFVKEEIVVDQSDLISPTTTELEATTTDIASTTDPTPEVVYVQASLINDSNRHQFSVDECVLVGDGSYYCNKNNNVGVATQDSVVYAAPDADGDKEIFFNDGKELLQITDNNFDDDAPEYDALSNTVVWHRLVDGRYQIVSYDLDEEEETILTKTATNNMEPSREDGMTVWQRWVVDNWEIVLYDGVDETILTHNAVHDIAPDIEGGYIIWHSSDSKGQQQVVVYEIETGLLSYINDTEGGEVTNPRFVLVYDTKFDNGDTITKGFDPETGELVPLSAQPGEVPLDIPESDSTGETRALINTKSSGREDSLEKLILKPVTPTTDDDSSVATSTSDILVNTLDAATSTPEIVEEGVLDLSTSTPEISENLPLTDLDIIIEPYVATSTQTNSGTTTDSNVE